jgi:hypothetical protein
VFFWNTVTHDLVFHFIPTGPFGIRIMYDMHTIRMYIYTFVCVYMTCLCTQNKDNIIMYLYACTFSMVLLFNFPMRLAFYLPLPPSFIPTLSLLIVNWKHNNRLMQYIGNHDFYPYLLDVRKVWKPQSFWVYTKIIIDERVRQLSLSVLFERYICDRPYFLDGSKTHW